MTCAADDGIIEGTLLGRKLQKFPRDLLDIVRIMQTARTLDIGRTETLLRFFKKIIERRIVPVECFLVDASALT